MVRSRRTARAQSTLLCRLAHLQPYRSGPDWPVNVGYLEWFFYYNIPWVWRDSFNGMPRWAWPLAFLSFLWFFWMPIPGGIIYLILDVIIRVFIIVVDRLGRIKLW